MKNLNQFQTNPLTGAFLVQVQVGTDNFFPNFGTNLVQNTFWKKFGSDHFLVHK